MGPKFVSKDDAERGFELRLIDDAANKTDWTITILGADSDAYREKQRELQTRNIANINRARRLVQTPADIESDALELIVAATRGWSGIEFDGKALPFSPENARRLYSQIPGIREQIDRAINERANFLPQTATP